MNNVKNNTQYNRRKKEKTQRKQNQNSSKKKTTQTIDGKFQYEKKDSLSFSKKKKNNVAPNLPSQSPEEGKHANYRIILEHDNGNQYFYEEHENINVAHWKGIEENKKVYRYNHTNVMLIQEKDKNGKWVTVKEYWNPGR